MIVPNDLVEPHIALIILEKLDGWRSAKASTMLAAAKAGQVASQSVTATALTLDAHMETLRELRDKADQRGQLRRFYVKQVETGDAGEFERMSIEELREYIYGQGKILATLDEKLPPKVPKGPVKH